jgi:hypothetical protein
MLIRATGWEQIRRQPGDNDLIHQEEHTRFMKTDTWLHLPEFVKQRHLLHQVEHLNALEQTQGRPVVTGAEDAFETPDAAGPEEGSQPAAGDGGEQNE